MRGFILIEPDVVKPVHITHHTDPNAPYMLIHAHGPQVATTPTHHIVLLQTSFSMTTLDRIGTAREALKQFVGTLTAQDHFSLICFRDSATLELDHLQMNRVGRAQALRFLDTASHFICRGRAQPTHGLHKVRRQVETRNGHEYTADERNQGNQLQSLHIFADGYWPNTHTDTMRQILAKCNLDATHVYATGKGCLWTPLQEILGESPITLEDLRGIQARWPSPTSRPLQLATCLRIYAEGSPVDIHHIPDSKTLIRTNPYKDGSIAVPLGSLEAGETRSILLKIRPTESTPLVEPQLCVETYSEGRLLDINYIELEIPDTAKEDAQPENPYIKTALAAHRDTLRREFVHPKTRLVKEKLAKTRKLKNLTRQIPIRIRPINTTHSKWSVKPICRKRCSVKRYHRLIKRRTPLRARL